MARLTILQASQQGFGSTLTIHRHIKDGALPVYEDGDTKLLDVDDLIAVFGEPGVVAGDTVAPAANGQVDIHEFNRIKAELDQKNKKNMWLAADLAEVVRELKEKEASFEKERNRLLTVLEQAQALLLREAGKDGKLKAAMEEAGTTEIIAGETTPSDPMPPLNLTQAIDDAPEVSIDFGANMDTGDQTTIDAAEKAIAAEPEQSLEDLLPKLGIPSSDTAADAPSEALATPDSGAETDLGVPEPNTGGPNTDINPMMPPLDDPDAKPGKSRSIGISTWILLFAMAGGGFLLFHFRTNVVTGLAKLGKIVSGF